MKKPFVSAQWQAFHWHQITMTSSAQIILVPTSSPPLIRLTDFLGLSSSQAVWAAEHVFWKVLSASPSLLSPKPHLKKNMHGFYQAWILLSQHPKASRVPSLTKTLSSLWKVSFAYLPPKMWTETITSSRRKRNVKSPCQFATSTSSPGSLYFLTPYRIDPEFHCSRNDPWWDLRR